MSKHEDTKNALQFMLSWESPSRGTGSINQKPKKTLTQRSFEYRRGL